MNVESDRKCKRTTAEEEEEGDRRQSVSVEKSEPKFGPEVEESETKQTEVGGRGIEFDGAFELLMMKLTRCFGLVCLSRKGSSVNVLQSGSATKIRLRLSFNVCVCVWVGVCGCLATGRLQSQVGSKAASNEAVC
jgi:hypothetical protein